MNNTPHDLHALTERVQQIAANLANVQADVALLARLKDAEADRDRTAALLSEAQDTLSMAMADNIAAQQAAFAATIRNVSVQVSYPDALKTNLVSTRFTITFSKQTYNGYESLWTEQSIVGFRCLPQDVLAYIVETRPALIPSVIMNLAPGDTVAAINAYFIGMQRGFISAQGQ